MHLQENTNLTFDLDLGVKVTRNIAQYPLQHVTCLGTKFEVAPSYGLGGDIFTRNLRMDACTDGQTDRRTMDKLCYEINIPFFSKEKSGYNKGKVFQSNMSMITVDGNCMTEKNVDRDV